MVSAGMGTVGFSRQASGVARPKKPSSIPRRIDSTVVEWPSASLIFSPGGRKS